MNYLSFPNDKFVSTEDYVLISSLPTLPESAIKNYHADFATGFKRKTVSDLTVRKHIVVCNSKTEKIFFAAKEADRKAKGLEKELSGLQDEAYHGNYDSPYFAENSTEAEVKRKSFVTNRIKEINSAVKFAETTRLALHSHCASLTKSKSSNALLA